MAVLSRAPAAMMAMAVERRRCVAHARPDRLCAWERVMPALQKTEFDINGSRVAIDVDGERSLLSVLRDDLNLTGTKYGCGERQCGACVVLVNGHPTPACATPVSAVQGQQILTIEGLAQGGRLHPVQQ